MSIAPSQRFTADRRCPICGGCPQDPRHTERRCHGFFSDDGCYAHCSREEHAGDLLCIPGSCTYAHRLDGRCRCGLQHGAAAWGTMRLKTPHNAATDVQRIEYARKLWATSKPASGTPVERYLTSRRGITVTIPPTIRFLPDAKHKSGRRSPAMVAAVQASTGRIEGVHRTFLSPDGTGKTVLEPSKMMLGRCAGGAVRLAAPGTKLAIAEGIETALSVLQATGLPTWAALSAAGLASVILPQLPLANDVVIFADHDSPGIAAARRAASRFWFEGRSVRIALPPRAGIDFNDVLNGVA